MGIKGDEWTNLAAVLSVCGCRFYLSKHLARIQAVNCRSFVRDGITLHHWRRLSRARLVHRLGVPVNRNRIVGGGSVWLNFCLKKIDSVHQEDGQYGANTLLVSQCDGICMIYVDINWERIFFSFQKILYQTWTTLVLLMISLRTNFATVLLNNCRDFWSLMEITISTVSF